MLNYELEGYEELQLEALEDLIFNWLNLEWLEWILSCLVRVS